MAKKKAESLTVYTGRIAVWASGGWERVSPVVVEAKNLQTAVQKIIDSQPHRVISLRIEDKELNRARKKAWEEKLKRT